MEDSDVSSGGQDEQIKDYMSYIAKVNDKMKEMPLERR